MACNVEQVTVERVWIDEEPIAFYKLPSGYVDKIILVIEDPEDVRVVLLSQECCERFICAVVDAATSTVP